MNKGGAPFCAATSSRFDLMSSLHETVSSGIFLNSSWRGRVGLATVTVVYSFQGNHHKEQRQCKRDVSTQKAAQIALLVRLVPYSLSLNPKGRKERMQVSESDFAQVKAFAK